MFGFSSSWHVLRYFLSATLIAFTTSAYADNLVIGIKDTPFTIDPHFNTSPGPNQITRQIFEPLVRVNADMKLEPMLATSWENVDDTTWIFHLRKDVKWHDGSPFTADDVVFSYARAPNVPNATNRFTSYLSSVKSVEIEDPLTIRITTNQPAPTLPENLNYVGIVSKKHGENATTDDYHSGKAMVGTGPYKFVSWTLNDNVQLQRNENYWSAKEPWERVTYRVMPNDATRVAALLAGDLDAIDQVPSQDLKRLRETPSVSTYTKPTIRLVWYSLSVSNAALDSGLITGPNGERLAENPLANKKVREALKLSVDTKLLLERLYVGEGQATAQVTPVGAVGTNPEVKPWAANPEKAKALLQESGWAGKFKLKLRVPNQLFLFSNEVAQIVAQYWSRIGVPTSVETPALPVFLKDAHPGNIGPYIISILNVTGASDFLYRTALHSRDMDMGLGTFNFGRYSNPELDGVTKKAERTMNRSQWGKLYEQAAVLVADDAMTVPLFFMGETVATRKGLNVEQRFDGMVFASTIRKK